ncbi:MAG: molybdopterin cofactor-binding domain-containing protein [Pseudomonadota bacterium]
MGRMRTIARRTFLIGTAAIAGGVAFGTYAVRSPHENPMLADLGEGEASFNPWVKITPEKITLIGPHTDLGQGARSMQAALIAEEMDLAWGQFEVEPGMPSPAYYNTASADEAVPFISTDESLAARTMRGVAGAAIKLLGMQVTGGSTSVADSYEKLRIAGAVARETLKLAASQASGVAVADLQTEDGAVVLPDGRRMAYTSLAGAAAKLEPVTEVALRDPGEWRLIGQKIPRLDVLQKSTGALTYGIDLAFEGMVHATVKRNPRQGGAMKSYDATAALKMRGVSQVLPISGGVAVLADNTWRAFRAAEAVVFEWEAAPFPAEQEAHWAEAAASFTEERLDSAWRDDGDVAAGLAGGSVIEAEYRAPYVAHAPLEPLSAIAQVADGRVDIWVAHQLPRFAQEKVAEIVGLPVENVYLHNQFAGGSFGHRLEFDNVTLAVEIARQVPDTPVKLTLSREEDMLHDYPRQLSVARMKGAGAEGRVDTLDLQIAATSPVASQSERLGVPVPGPDAQIAAGAWNQPLAIPNYRVRAYRVPGLAPVSSWRSVGASSTGFFADCALDEVIHAAGGDPLEERLRLATNDEARAVLEAVGEMSGWGNTLGEGRGRGVGFVESFGVPVAEVVEVTMTEQGIRIDKAFIAAEVGTVVDPITFENVTAGGVIWGLGHAINAEITYRDGIAEQTNYHAHEAMRLYQTPEIFVRGLETSTKVRGIGEPPVPPAAPALANAIFAATGTRIREMPFNKFIDFV